MASFERRSEEWNRLDYRLLRDHPVTLYYRRAVLEDDLRWLEGEGYEAYRLDALSEIEIPELGGMALAFLGFDRFAARLPQTAWHVCDVLAQHSRHALRHGLRSLALLQSDDPRIRFEGVGATPVGWNPREWLNETRGL